MSYVVDKICYTHYNITEGQRYNEVIGGTPTVKCGIKICHLSALCNAMYGM